MYHFMDILGIRPYPLDLCTDRRIRAEFQSVRSPPFHPSRDIRGFRRSRSPDIADNVTAFLVDCLQFLLPCFQRSGAVKRRIENRVITDIDAGINAAAFLLRDGFRYDGGGAVVDCLLYGFMPVRPGTCRRDQRILQAEAHPFAPCIHAASLLNRTVHKSSSCFRRSAGSSVCPSERSPVIPRQNNPGLP